MHSPVTAIIHFRRESIPAVREIFEAMVGPLTGVEEVRFRPGEFYATVFFDAARTSIAEIVRALEDIGAVVTGIARRPGETVSRVQAARFWQALATPPETVRLPRLVGDYRFEMDAASDPPRL